MAAHVADFERIAQIRFIRAIFEHGFGKWNADKIGIDRAPLPVPIGKFLKYAAQHRFNRLEDIFLGDKAHLEIELVKFTGRPIGTRIFVPETGRDLEIAIKTSDHDQLFEHLRCLRQRIEFARMDAAWNQIVARAFRR